MSTPGTERPPGAGERGRPDETGSTAGGDAEKNHSEGQRQPIAASDYPLLVRRINELRDARQSGRHDIENHLRTLIESPTQELAEEVARLRSAQPNVQVAIDALIDGSSAAYFEKRPHMKDMVMALASGNGTAPPNQDRRRGSSEETIETVLTAAGFDAIPSPLPPDHLEQLLGALARAFSTARPIRRAALREGAIGKLKAAGFKSAASVVDAAIGERKQETVGKQGQALELQDPIPWPEAVDGVTLLDQIVAVFKKYVILPPFAAEAAALWTMHTYAVQIAFDCSPRLAITGPTKRCGKSRLLEVLAGLVRRPLLTENISAAGMFRIIEQSAPTLLIDEGDTFLRDNEGMRGLLNAGQRRGGAVVRVVGEDLEPRSFGVFAPVAIACIGELSDTVRDRSIAIPMRRRAADEVVARLRPADYREEVAPLVRKLMRWTTDHAEILKSSKPSLPKDLDDRAADGWEPLLAIADFVGGAWPVLAREAAIRLSADRAEVDDSKGVLLLSDLRELFEASAAEKLSSEELVTSLTTLEDRPWSEWGRQRKPITPPQIARLLKPFGIKPLNLRVPGGKVLKGYQRSDFKDTWARYATDPKRYAATPPGTPGENGSATDAVRSGSVADQVALGGHGERSGVAGRNPDDRGMRDSPASPPVVSDSDVHVEEVDGELRFDVDENSGP